MRVIHFSASKVWRGHEQMIVDLYESLRDNNFVDDQLIICTEDSILNKVATERNLNVHTFQYKSEFDLKFSKKIRTISEDFGAEVFVMHNSKAHTLGVLSSLFFGLKTPLVLCRTLIVNVGTNYLRKFKYNYSGIKKIICISDAVVEVLKPTIKNHDKMTVVGSVVDTDRFINNNKTGQLHQEYNIPEDYKLIGNVSAFCLVKDHITWVNTVAELHKRKLKAKYILIGEGSLEDEIKAYAKSKGLENEIIFAGYRNDIHKCISEFDLFLFTSKLEATGGVVLESYACKVPVVAANAGGIPTILIDNETGLLAKVGNPVDFADKVEIVINDKLLQEKFIKNGYDFLMNTSTRLIIGTKFADVLREVKNRNRLEERKKSKFIALLKRNNAIQQ